MMRVANGSGGKTMRGSLRSFIWVLLGHLILATPALGAEAVRLAILPFQVHSAEDLGYLQKGIRDMLASRVGQGGGFSIVQSPMAPKQGDVSGLDLAKAASMGKELRADFVVFGSITKLGDHISLDGELVDVRTGSSSAHLFAEASHMDEVIPQVSRMAQDIRRAALGKAGQTVAKAPAQPPPTEGPLPQQQIVPGTSGIAYPEPPGGYPRPPGGFTDQQGGEIFTRSDEDAILSGGQDALNPSFIMSYEADKRTRGYVKSPKLDIKVIQAIDAGDTDGDGMAETVVADEDKLYIYENVMAEEGHRQIIKPDAVFGKILALDVADVNRNGMDEIYVTTIEGTPIGTPSQSGGKQKLVSQAIEFRDGKYQTIAERLPYFLRVTRSVHHGLVLLGQEKPLRIMTDRHSDFFVRSFGEAFHLLWKDGQLVRGEELPLKEQVCVLGLTMVDVDHDGLDEYLGYDERDYLTLFNAQGKSVWSSVEPYGRTANYFIKDLKRELAPNEEPLDLNVWLPAKIQTVDLDNDGFEEIILDHNYEPLSFSTRVRWFTKGAVFSLSWDGVDFMENWRTREMKGYVSDFTVKDVDQDGKPELLIGLVQKGGVASLFKPKVSLIAFDLEVEDISKAEDVSEEELQPLDSSAGMK
jgi:TolB-like protein